VTLPTRPLFFALVLALLPALLVWMLLRGGDAFSPSRPLRLATWNMEWLVTPETLRQARIACRDRRQSPLPCDVVRNTSRDSADLRAIAREVRRLGADVIAFQEVEAPSIARRVFRGYAICMARIAPPRSTASLPADVAAPARRCASTCAMARRCTCCPCT
jgi:hypothetical protein